MDPERAKYFGRAGLVVLIIGVAVATDVRMPMGLMWLAAFLAAIGGSQVMLWGVR